MDSDKRSDVASLLETLPPVEFCAVYGSSLHQNNFDKTSMIDYILGVVDPHQWHAVNLKLNRDHYASWMIRLGGAPLITGVADDIGVGVHFNPFVSYKSRVFKYGIVRMHDLVLDILEWKRFYISGRLQKPVNIIVDTLELENLNAVNLKAATAAALLLLPSKFSEEELYAKICSLSYMGDLRMIFAEDKDKDCGLSTALSLASSLPPTFRSNMGIKAGENKAYNESGGIAITSKQEAADCVRKILTRKVMVSSARQAIAGLVTTGVFHGFRYLSRKMHKAWKSW